jgi:putative membrane protein
MNGWEFDPWITIPLAISALLYARGTWSLWQRAGAGRGVPWWQAAAFLAGWLTLVSALVSPLHEWSEHLFAAHMVEHELLMAVAAPLLCAANPLGPLLRGFPKGTRGWLIRAGAARPIPFVWRGLMIPAVATILHAVAIWAWHIPSLLDGTLTHEWMHRLQHVSFLGTALVFWWSILRRPRREYGAAALHIFATMMHMSLLGALLALAPRVYYPLQCAGAPAFGLSPLEDQQLAGLIMWVPAGTLYILAGVLAVGVWLGSGTSRNPRPSRAVLV